VSTFFVAYIYAAQEIRRTHRAINFEAAVMIVGASINLMLLFSEFFYCKDLLVIALETTNELLILLFCWMFTKRVSTIANEF